MMTFRTPIRFVSRVLLPSVALANSLCAATLDQEQLLAEIHSLKARLESMEQALETIQAEQATQTAATQAASSNTSSKPMVVKKASSPKVSLEFYGYVKADAFYDSCETFVDAIPFWVVPENAAGTNTDGEFGLTVKESRFGVRMKGPDLAGGTIGGNIEFDFYGNVSTSGHHAYTPRSRHAYVDWTNGDWSLLAGKTWETYLIVFPKTVNFTAYNLQGQLGLRHAQLRLSRHLALSDTSKLSLHLAIAEPLGSINGGDLDVDGQDDGANSGMPLFEFKAAYSMQRLKVGISGFYGQEHLSDPDSDYDTWAVIVGGELQLTKQLSLRGTLWTGTNLDGAWGGIGQGINLDRQSTIDGTGGWVQLGYKATSKLSFNLGFSIDDPKDADLNPSQRSRNRSILLNTFYQFDPALSLGLEYLRLETSHKNLETARANRLQSMVKYSF